MLNGSHDMRASWLMKFLVFIRVICWIIQDMCTIPPNQEVFKANVDVAYKESDLYAASALVVRDHAGNIVSCASYQHYSVESALHGEFLALRYGVETVATFGFVNVLSGSDYLQVIKELKRGLASFK